MIIAYDYFVANIFLGKKAMKSKYSTVDPFLPIICWNKDAKINHYSTPL